MPSQMFFEITNACGCFGGTTEEKRFAESRFDICKWIVVSFDARMNAIFILTVNVVLQIQVNGTDWLLDSLVFSCHNLFVCFSMLF